ncbi:LppX_LprAFG lipoprotein [Chloroflexota bacterium]
MNEYGRPFVWTSVVVVVLAVSLLVTACREEPGSTAAPTKVAQVPADKPVPPIDTPLPSTASPSPAPTPTPSTTLTPSALSARSLLAAAHGALEEKSHHVASEVHVTMDQELLTVDMTVTLESDAQPPDRRQSIVTMEFFGSPVEMDMIVSGETVYVSDPETGAWSIGPDPVAPFSGEFFTGLGLTDLEGMTYIGEEMLDGIAVHHLKGTASPEALGLTQPSVETGLQGEVFLEYWIGAKDGLLQQSTGEGRLTITGGLTGTMSVSFTATFSDYGKPVDIQPPEIPAPEPTDEPVDPASIDSSTFSAETPGGRLESASECGE